jgi:uncharacterized glyoxalase superfamily protein PhnB
MHPAATSEPFRTTIAAWLAVDEATQVAPVSDEYGWRTGRVTDPFGYDWELSRQLTA